MRRIKMITATLFAILGLNCTPVMAAEVTPTDAYLWTNGTANIQVDDTFDAAIVEGPTVGKKLHITGITTNAYWQVDFNGVPAYIPGPGLSDVVVNNGIITKYYDMPVIDDELATVIVNSTEYNTVNGHFAINYTGTNKTASNMVVGIEAFSAGYANAYDWETATQKRGNLANWMGHSNGDKHEITSVLAPNETKLQRLCYDTDLETGNQKNEVSDKLFKLRFSVSNNDEYGIYRNYNSTKFYDFASIATKMEQESGLRSNQWK